jgi:hypothetical protein
MLLMGSCERLAGGGLLLLCVQLRRHRDIACRRGSCLPAKCARFCRLGAGHQVSKGSGCEWQQFGCVSGWFDWQPVGVPQQAQA